tara:strand:- start:78 stop:668 length:591 start_codon:yes stop_codon:yes gene_type:complete
MALGCHGGQREAVRAEARRAAALDPVNYVVTYVGGFALQLAGLHDDALVETDWAIELDPTLPYAYSVRAATLLASGDTEGALSAVRRADALAHNQMLFRSMVAVVLARAGKEFQVRAVVTERESQLETGLIRPAACAMARQALGEREAALALLAREARIGYPVLWLYVMWGLDAAFGEDPGFAKIRPALGLAQCEG